MKDLLAIETGVVLHWLVFGEGMNLVVSLACGFALWVVWDMRREIKEIRASTK